MASYTQPNSHYPLIGKTRLFNRRDRAGNFGYSTIFEFPCNTLYPSGHSMWTFNTVYVLELIVKHLRQSNDARSELLAMLADCLEKEIEADGRDDSTQLSEDEIDDLQRTLDLLDAERDNLNAGTLEDHRRPEEDERWSEATAIEYGSDMYIRPQRNFTIAFPSKYLAGMGESKWRFSTRQLLDLICDDLDASEKIELYVEDNGAVYGSYDSALLRELTEYFFPAIEPSKWTSLDLRFDKGHRKPCEYADGFENWGGE
ncbi:hypothetical protein [Rhizobium sp. LjRoot254]|uniref:hypothetical protein n=1 Tax=Rhizobium sp. LjRoot254 TaxID=3342297 RepID=UPI003ECD763A